MLEHIPEDFGSMKERYHLAVAETIDAEKVRDGLIPPPTKDRKHVSIILMACVLLYQLMKVIYYW